ncbi:MAG: cyclodeaminase/cyclohydrolase family protein [Gaiellaceae bacterium]
MDSASGGGPLAALVTAAAAELLANIARASSEDWPDARGVAAQAESLHDRVKPLAALTAEAYDHALNADGGDYEVGRAYAGAAEPPLRIAEAAADVAALAALVAEHVDPARRADAVTAGLVAAGCARAAAELVAVNLTMSAGDERVRRVNLLAEEAAHAAEAARAARE